MSGAARLAQQRIERAQARDAARGQARSNNATSSGAYGSFFEGNTGAPKLQDGRGPKAPGLGGDSLDVFSQQMAGSGSSPVPPALAARKSMVLEDAAQAAAPSAAMPPSGPLTEMGLPVIGSSISGAFHVVSKEGAMHENHDKGHAVILPGGTCLFACLDGHGTDGAAVSGFGLRNLLAGAAAALSAGKAPREAIQYAFEITARGLAEAQAKGTVDCKFSGSTAILSVLTRGPAGRILTTGWTGDSRAVIARSRNPGVVGKQKASATTWHTIPVTKDHKPDDPEERARLAKINAIVRPSRVQHPQTGQVPPPTHTPPPRPPARSPAPAPAPAPTRA